MKKIPIWQKHMPSGDILDKSGQADARRGMREARNYIPMQQTSWRNRMVFGSKISGRFIYYLQWNLRPFKLPEVCTLSTLFICSELSSMTHPYVPLCSSPVTQCPQICVNFLPLDICLGHSLHLEIPSYC